MRAAITGAACGLIFALGLVLSGMVNPAKVLNFLDVMGHWDPSLAFVMGGAVIVTFIGYRFVLRRERPLAAERFSVPTGNRTDARLLAGAALFGIGWGLVGLCPGPALTALSSGKLEPVLFVVAMAAGMKGYDLVNARPKPTRGQPV